jgi:large subunit ribosomal protein L29
MKTNEIRKLSTEEINKKIAESKEELFNLRMKQATGNLENPSRIRELRKTVARLKTILKEREIEG